MLKKNPKNMSKFCPLEIIKTKQDFFLKERNSKFVNFIEAKINEGIYLTLKLTKNNYRT
jgi:hypothetical protein